MHRRGPRLLLSLLMLTTAGCGRTSISAEEATQVAVDAFASAGLDAEVGEIEEQATVDRAIDGQFVQVHQVEMVVDDRSYLAGVDRELGAVIRLVEPSDTALTDDHVQAIAEYRDDSAAADARRTRTITWTSLVLLGIAAAVVFFERERRKARLDDDDDVIPLA